LCPTGHLLFQPTTFSFSHGGLFFSFEPSSLCSAPVAVPAVYRVPRAPALLFNIFASHIDQAPARVAPLFTSKARLFPPFPLLFHSPSLGRDSPLSKEGSTPVTGRLIFTPRFFSPFRVPPLERHSLSLEFSRRNFCCVL